MSRRRRAGGRRLLERTDAHAQAGSERRDDSLKIKLKYQLKRLLAESDITAAELARQTGVTKQSLSDWIGGIPPRNITAVKQVANFFGITVDELLFGNNARYGAGARHDAQQSSDRSGMAEVIGSFGSREALVLVIGFDGRIKSSSLGVQTLLAAPGDALQERPLVEIFYAHDWELCLFLHRRHVDQGLTVAGLVARVVASTGCVIPLVWRTMLFPEEDLIMASAEDLSTAMRFIDGTSPEPWLEDLAHRVAHAFNSGPSHYGWRVVVETRLLHAVPAEPNLVGRILLMGLHDLSWVLPTASVENPAGNEIRLSIESSDRGAVLGLEAPRHGRPQRDLDLTLHRLVAERIDARIDDVSTKTRIALRIELPTL